MSSEMSNAISHNILAPKPNRKLSSARPDHSAIPADAPIPTSPATAGNRAVFWRRRTIMNTTESATGAVTEGTNSPVRVKVMRKPRPGARDSTSPRVFPTADHRASTVGASPGVSAPKPVTRKWPVPATSGRGSATVTHPPHRVSPLWVAHEVEVSLLGVEGYSHEP